MIAITGCTGLVGRNLAEVLQRRGYLTCLLSRAGPSLPPSQGSESRILGSLGSLAVNPEKLSGCTVVVHAAARAHIMREAEEDPLAAYRMVNVRGTVMLAHAAVAAGVKRFIFISSIGVLGNCSQGKPLAPGDPVCPVEDYAISKLEAETALREIAEKGRMEVVIIRLPLVHGPGARGNFLRLMRAVARGTILPLGSALNRRSFVGVLNLADALAAVATAPCVAQDAMEAEARTSSLISAALFSTFHVADDGCISTRRLVEVIAKGMGRSPNLINVPPSLVYAGATLLGKRAEVRRLFGNLEVDDTEFRRSFSWHPRVGLEEGIESMSVAYREEV